jgi:hypothetical protein
VWGIDQVRTARGAYEGQPCERVKVLAGPAHLGNAPKPCQNERRVRRSAWLIRLTSAEFNHGLLPRRHVTLAV